MPQSLRSILGTSNRVRKPAHNPPPSLLHRQTSSRSPQKKAGKRTKKDGDNERRDTEIFEKKLEDLGVARLLAQELTLRDVVQAMRYIRSKMFTPVPSSGFNSTRTSELLHYRASMPPIVTMGHLHAILSSPAKVERELVELQTNGVLRKMRIERRGGQGEALIESSDLDAMLEKVGISMETRARYRAFMKENPAALTLSPRSLTEGQVDELIRAGFLTSSAQYAAGSTLHMRPEERTTLASIDSVSRQASGSVSAVGGRNAIHLAGGGSGGLGLHHEPPSPSSTSPSSTLALTHLSSSSSSSLRLAIPGHGRYLKLATAAMDWLKAALGRTKWGECPESWLQERFEGGGLYEGPRWKEFWGLEWEWVVGEAVGLGVVELFDTGSVGKGVRALGG